MLLGLQVIHIFTFRGHLMFNPFRTVEGGNVPPSRHFFYDSKSIGDIHLNFSYFSQKRIDIFCQKIKVTGHTWAFLRLFVTQP